MSSTPLKTVHIGAHFPGVNATTVWSDPAAGSNIDFASFAHMARVAEAAKFDFFFLAEGLRLREKHGLIHDLDVVGRPDTFTILAALAAVTDRLGLVGTINSTYNEPYEVARQFATLDHLSDGRAAWNVVTSSGEFFGANFRRGGFLDYDRRYERAGELLEVSRTLWDSWSGADLVIDKEKGIFERDRAGSFDHRGEHFDIRGRFTVPASPQGDPVIFQAGDSEAGRDFGAAHADVIFTIARPLEQAQQYYREVKGRLSRHGRALADLRILPAVTFALGDTQAEAQDRAHEIRSQQVSGQTAIQHLEQVWNRDLSQYDPDGPLPAIDPDPGPLTLSQGQSRSVRDPFAVVRGWRELAEAKGLSIRELVIEIAAKQTFVGTPSEVADQINDYVQADASDGVILAPHITPSGIDDFAARVVPELQERGVFRTEYEGSTLRDHLGLPPAGTRQYADAGIRASEGVS
jgi:FMN-dependent oxidoreductase (nitrilotriacetate monooxygenase family)